MRDVKSSDQRQTRLYNDAFVKNRQTPHGTVSRQKPHIWRITLKPGELSAVDVAQKTLDNIIVKEKRLAQEKSAAEAALKKAKEGETDHVIANLEAALEAAKAKKASK